MEPHVHPVYISLHYWAPAPTVAGTHPLDRVFARHEGGWPPVLVAPFDIRPREFTRRPDRPPT
jgi:hypothetical protein